MPFGVMGKVLWVDLTTGQTFEEIIPESVYRRFLSGIGLAAYLLYRDIPPEANALGPENILCFVSGILAGTNSLFTGRWMAAAKSPLTGTWGEANCGGTLAPAIKRCGYDGIFVKGTSPHPVYLLVYNGKIELRNAVDIWGKDAVETDEILRGAHPNSAVACIGTAGEKRSLMAGICNDSGRLAARSGLGAVMGSKMLKAVVLAGREKILVKDKQAMQKMNTPAYRWVRANIPLPPGRILKYVGSLMRLLPFQWAQDGLLYKSMLNRWGTVSMNQVSVEMGDAPVKNWRGSEKTFPLQRSDSTNPDYILNSQKKKYHCRACALGCGGIVTNAHGMESHKPEYETVLSWGGLLENNDLDSIFQINDRLNRAGIDSISAGATVAFAFECAEHNLLPPEFATGSSLRWGDSQAILALVDQIIAREGIGALLADGSRIAAQRIGPQAAAFAVHAGGQELAMHDGRNDPGFALHAVVEPMPGRHTSGSQLYYEMFRLWTRIPGVPRQKFFYKKHTKYQANEEQAAAAVACSRFGQVINGAGMCLFGAFIGVSRIPLFEWLNAATGWKLKPEDYMDAGSRIQTLKQIFNIKQGAPLRHEISLRAVGQPPLTHGANQGRTLNIDQMVRQYWELSGWDPETGIPGKAAINDLALDGFERQ